MDGLFAQYASRIYPRVRLFTTSPCKSLDLQGEFYIAILLARINARLQALLRQGFGIPSENEKVKTEN
jgi:hypothetical protein